ncbi:ComEC/Rec2 family competence protein [Streptomyces reniochalinae]|uniref:ComEC/Rec2 family competence protein n=1 Tax=Streptomyces reniochalinae TaxID=2250578 RepID=A0A367ECZ4_9ACTN|nr:ComEC/Rec2 family competence protein [Streptomyces reniochalinae]
MAAWAAAAGALGVSGTRAAVGVALSGLAGLALVAFALRGRSVRTAPPGRAATPSGAAGNAAPGTAAQVGHGARRRTVLLGAAVSLLCAAAAGGSAALHAADLRRGPLPELAERQAEVTVELTVTKDPRVTRPRVRGSQQSPGVVVVQAQADALVAGDGSRTRLRTPVLLLVRLDGEGGGAAGEGRGKDSGHDSGPEVNAPPSRTAWLRLLPSTRLRIRGDLVRPDSDRRGGRDVAAVLRADSGPPEVIGRPTAVQRAAGRLRAGLRSAVTGLDEDARGLLPGLVVGDTSGLSRELEDAFRATDMTHLLAVSGANLSILLVLLIGPPGLAHRAERRGLAPRLGLPLRTTAVVAALLTLGFVVVCRPEPSVLRAAACGLITVWAIGTGRRRSLLPALAAAVLVLVFYDPWLARDFGFLLSVLATASLLTVAPCWSAALRRRGWPGRPAEALAAAAAAQAGCAPVVAVLAAHVSLVAVPCNLLAEFAVAPATVLGFAALVAAPLAMPVAKGLAWLASWPVEAIAGIARTGAGLPGAEIGWPGSWPGALGLATLLAVLFLVAARLRLPYRPWWCAACVLALLLAVVRPVPLVRPFTGWPPTGWRMVACDVGQGDALVLAVDAGRGGAGGAVVVDAGPDPAAVDRCLTRLGVTSVPLVVLTHFHADHVAGVTGVLRGRKVGAVETTGLERPPGQAEFVREAARRAGVPVLTARAGERRRVGDLRWEVVWPQQAAGDGVPGGSGLNDGRSGEADGESGEGANDASVTLLVRTAGLSLFLAGDLEPEAQRGLLALRPDLPRADVLKVAHHGSRFQDPELMRRLRPRVALVSAGRDNPYGHPAPETLDALAAAGALVARTDRNGALALVRRPDGTPAVVTQRGDPVGGGPVAAGGGPDRAAASGCAPAPDRGAVLVRGAVLDRGAAPDQAVAAVSGRGVAAGYRERAGRLSRSPASPRVPPRARPGGRCRRRRADLRGRPATVRPRRRPPRRGRRGPVRAPHRDRAAVRPGRPPPRPRPCRAVPVHAVRRSPSPGHSPSGRPCRVGWGFGGSWWPDTVTGRREAGRRGWEVLGCRCGVGSWSGWLRVRRPPTIRWPP